MVEEVTNLDCRFAQAGCPCDENLYVHLFKDLDLKQVAKKLRLWRGIGASEETCAKNKCHRVPDSGGSGGAQVHEIGPSLLLRAQNSNYQMALRSDQKVCTLAATSFILKSVLCLSHSGHSLRKEASAMLCEGGQGRCTAFVQPS